MIARRHDHWNAGLLQGVGYSVIEGLPHTIEVRPIQQWLLLSSNHVAGDDYRGGLLFDDRFNGRCNARMVLSAPVPSVQIGDQHESLGSNLTGEQVEAEKGKSLAFHGNLISQDTFS